MFRALQNFTSRFPFLLTYLLLFGIASVLGLVADIISGAGELAQSPVRFFLLPNDFSVYLHQPWSVFTWPFLTPLDSIHVFPQLMNALFLYFFSRILRDHLGDTRWQSFFLFLMVISIPAALLSGIFPGAHEGTPYLFGPSAVMCGMASAAIALMPRWPVSLFLLGNVPLIFPGILILLLTFISPLTLSSYPLFFAMIAATGIGALHVWLLRRGWDLPERIQRPLTNVYYRLAGRWKGRFTVVKNDTHENDETEMNRLLDKIGVQGYEGLTREEKAWLEKYSRKGK